MSIIEAIILGIVQGLTEFLPVSSSGHLEIGKVLLRADLEEGMLFTVVVHGATVLSTIVVFCQEVLKLVKESFGLKLNDSNRYIFKILLSMMPVLLVGIFLEKQVESFFSGNLRFVGFMLLITAALLYLTGFVKKDGQKSIPFRDAFIIGIAQALAVLPGISRSGSTIATGVLLGNKREDVARFSFLMVLIPIIGANLLAMMENSSSNAEEYKVSVLLAGFISAFIAGLLACKWMINLVKKGKLIYFAAYCTLIGLIAIIFA
ncbi:MAG: undecaprenyl-diphosphate phosphatase [Bacteroidales bacterium]|nr:undecaprenyl-diphosphate phosphatase [Bacteroidales bacterium]